jgi:hypothetical protein
MLDSAFKQLQHKYLDFKIIHRGSELATGYKPDVVLQKDNQYIILESEHSTNRKTFLGGFLKAANFLTGNKHGFLVFVLKIQDNTNEDQISLHLGQYLNFISAITNLKEVYVISDENYCQGDQPCVIKGVEFLKSARKVDKDFII